MKGVDSSSGVIFERYPGCYQQIDGVLSEHVIIQIEFEIELPTRTSLGIISVFIGKRQTELNDFEKVDVAFERFVMEVGGEGFGDGTGDDTGEFGVHCYVGMSFDEFANDGHFLFDVFFPDIADFERFSGE